MGVTGAAPSLSSKAAFPWEGTTTPHPVRGQLASHFVDAVACGMHHVIVTARPFDKKWRLGDTGSTVLFAWGRGSEGQLGIASFADSATPLPVNLTDGRKASSIACGGAASALVSELNMEVFDAEWDRNAYDAASRRLSSMLESSGNGRPGSATLRSTISKLQFGKDKAEPGAERGVATSAVTGRPLNLSRLSSASGRASRADGSSQGHAACDDARPTVISLAATVSAPIPYAKKSSGLFHAGRSQPSLAASRSGSALGTGVAPSDPESASTPRMASEAGFDWEDRAHSHQFSSPGSRLTGARSLGAASPAPSNRGLMASAAASPAPPGYGSRQRRESSVHGDDDAWSMSSAASMRHELRMQRRQIAQLEHKLEIERRRGEAASARLDIGSFGVPGVVSEEERLRQTVAQTAVQFREAFRRAAESSKDLGKPVPSSGGAASHDAEHSTAAAPEKLASSLAQLALRRPSPFMGLSLSEASSGAAPPRSSADGASSAPPSQAAILELEQKLAARGAELAAQQAKLAAWAQELEAKEAELRDKQAKLVASTVTTLPMERLPSDEEAVSGIAVPEAGHAAATGPGDELSSVVEDEHASLPEPPSPSQGLWTEDLEEVRLISRSLVSIS